MIFVQCYLYKFLFLRGREPLWKHGITLVDAITLFALVIQKLQLFQQTRMFWRYSFPFWRSPLLYALEPAATWKKKGNKKLKKERVRENTHDRSTLVLGTTFLISANFYQLSLNELLNTLQILVRESFIWICNYFSKLNNEAKSEGCACKQF